MDDVDAKRMPEPAERSSQMELDRLLGTAEEAMTASVVTVDVDMDCEEVARELERRGVSGAPVTGGGRVVGVISLRDLAALSGMPIAMSSGPFLRFEGRLRGTRVEEAMSRPAVMIPADCPLARAAELMQRSGVNRLPVVNGLGEPVGILTRDDVIRAVASRTPDPSRSGISTD